MDLSSDLRSIQEARSLLERAKASQLLFKDFSQERVDKIVKAMASAGFEAREHLAKLAVEETGFGKWQDKVKKNIVGSSMLYDYIKDMKTCGIIHKNHDGKVWEVATPMGVVAALIPTTNPTSTMLYKSIISIKSRNAIVASPHPRAVRCTHEAATIVAKAASKAGAPEDLILCMTHPTIEGTSELMRHELTSVILATGSSAMVRAAYSSGKPAYGVGSGNVPAFIERSALIEKAVADIVYGKTFDNGTLCSSEQAIVCDLPIKTKVVDALKKRGGYFLSNEEKQKLERYMFPKGLNPEVVGMPATFIAERAGFSVPAQTIALIAELGSVGKKEILSAEKLSPVLAFYTEDGWEAGCKRCIELLEFGGIGHSLALHTQNENVIEQFALYKPAHRILINTVAAVGAVGYTTDLAPAMTLGPGTIGGSITTDNITPMHLLNIKRIAFETKPIHDSSGNPFSTDAELSSLKSSTVFSSNVANTSFSDLIDERIRQKAGNAPSKRIKEPDASTRKTSINNKSANQKLSDSDIEQLVAQFKK